LHKKANLITDDTDDTDLQVQNGLLNFSDPCKSVLSALSVVRFGVFVQSNR